MRARATVSVFVAAMLLAACGDATSDPAPQEISDLAEIANLDDGTEVVTQGVLIATGETRLCELLAESFPPQCGGESVQLGDLDLESVVAVQTVPDSQGVQISWTTYPLAVSGTVESGVLVDAAVAGQVYEVVEDGLRVRLMPAQTSFLSPQLRAGEDVWWAIDLTNTGEGSVPLTFTSGQRAEVTISDGDVELYRWADGQVFTQEVLDVVLEIDEVGASTLNDVLDVPAGADYMLHGWITAAGADHVVVTASVEVIEN